jgi:FMN phosphatase YigB (HAD superfamily)
LKIKAIFLDFYGTVVHEDDEIILDICNQIMESSSINCTVKEVGQYWWTSFSNLFQYSYGEHFQTQRKLGLESLNQTIHHFKSNSHAEELIKVQFDFWGKPDIFADSLLFFKNCRLPIYIVSNIDTVDIMSAIKHHNIQVDGVVTSEDVRSYKIVLHDIEEIIEQFDLQLPRRQHYPR